MKTVSGNKITAKGYRFRQDKRIIVYTLYEAMNFRKFSSIRRAKLLLAKNKYAQEVIVMYRVFTHSSAGQYTYVVMRSIQDEAWEILETFEYLTDALIYIKSLQLEVIMYQYSFTVYIAGTYLQSTRLYLSKELAQLNLDTYLNLCHSNGFEVSGFVHLV